MKTLFKEYGHAIIACVCAIFVFLFCFTPITFVEDEDAMTPLEYISSKSAGIIKNTSISDDSFYEYAKRGKPTIEIIEVRLKEKTPIKLEEYFFAQDFEGNELPVSFLKMETSDRQRVDVFNEEGYAIFPLADNYIVTVKATDSLRMETIRQFVLVVDYLPEDLELEEIEFVDYTVNHYRRVVSNPVSEIINYENQTKTDEWELIETENKKGKKNYETLIKSKQYSGLYLVENIKKSIEDGDVFDLYYEPKMCQLNITDNLGRDEVIEVIEGTKFSIVSPEVNGMYLPKITVNKEEYNGGVITITNEFLEKELNINLEYIPHGEINGFSGVYDKKMHGITVVPTLSDSTVYYSEDGVSWSTEKVLKQNAGFYKVYYKITNPNKEDAIGFEYIEIKKEHFEIRLAGIPYNKENHYTLETCSGIKQESQYYDFDFSQIMLSDCLTEYDIEIDNRDVAELNVIKTGYGCNEKEIYIKAKKTGNVIVTMSISDKENYDPFELTVDITFNPCETYHEYIETVSNASCTSNEVKRYECEKCGTISDVVTKIATGHKYTQGSNVKQYTSCTKDGLKYYKCSICNYQPGDYYVYEKAWGHDYKYDGAIVQYQSCTKDGIQYTKCSRCNTNGPTYVFGKAWGHWWNDQGSITQYANCEQGGYRHYLCRRDGCGAEGDVFCYQQALGHLWVGDVNDPSYANRYDYYENGVHNPNSFGDADGRTKFYCTRSECPGKTCYHSCRAESGYHNGKYYTHVCNLCGLYCKNY